MTSDIVTFAKMACDTMASGKMTPDNEFAKKQGHFSK